MIDKKYDNYARMLLIILLIGAMFTAFGCLSNSKEDLGTSSLSGCEIAWVGGNPPEDCEKLEADLLNRISPYPGLEYKKLNLSASEKTEGLHIRVQATAVSTPYNDLYDYSYRNGELKRTGYLLEAIPEDERNRAITTALRNEEIKGALGSEGPLIAPSSIKRILPDTAGKFYAPKTLLSVTWQEEAVSALIDKDNWEVVQVWKNA